MASEDSSKEIQAYDAWYKNGRRDALQEVANFQTPWAFDEDFADNVYTLLEREGIKTPEDLRLEELARIRRDEIADGYINFYIHDRA